MMTITTRMMMAMVMLLMMAAMMMVVVDGDDDADADDDADDVWASQIRFPAPGERPKNRDRLTSEAMRALETNRHVRSS